MHIAYSDNCSINDNEWISLHKPLQVFNACYNEQLDDLHDPYPVDHNDLYLVHSLGYVDGVLSGTEFNGFLTKDAQITRQVLAATGAMITASIVALTTGLCFAPVGGFHHAEYERGGGFCTFNGLTLSAYLLRRNQNVRKVMIIDLDTHYGNGTDNIIQKRGWGNWLYNFTKGHPLPYNNLDKVLESLLEKLVEWKPDLVLYQAGADAHIDDSMGSGFIEDRDWDRKDFTIFNACKSLGIPVAWCCAGGYTGKKTVILHQRTFAVSAEVFEPYNPTRNLEVYRGLKVSCDNAPLQTLTGPPSL